MPETSMLISVYLASVSIFAIVLTLYDKRAAGKDGWRVKERTLLLVSAIGGSVAMYATMRITRHKTKHLKFMVGIPLIILAQIAAAVLLRWLAA